MDKSEKNKPKNHKKVKKNPIKIGSSFPIVGIGASAGGLEAVTALLKEL